MLQTLFMAMALIAIGLIGGLMFGLMSMSSSGSGTESDGATSILNKVSNLRAGDSIADGASPGERVLPGIPVPPPKQEAGSGVIDLTGMSLAQRKDAFLAHKPEIGTKGAFPYYPDNSKLVDPNHDFTSYRAKGGSRFQEWKHGDSPYTYEKGESDDLARSRRYHVKKAMQFAWSAYEQYAFGMDEIKPETMTGGNGWGGFGTTLVDSLDTLWLMDMKDEFGRARDWVRDSLSNNRNRMVSFFETTIRSLGGLLAAYDLSGDEVFLEKANDLGKRLFKAVDSNPLGIPYGQVNLATGAVHNIPWTGDNSIVAEFGTIQIEFRLLARLTGNAEFKEKTEEIFSILKKMDPPHGLYPYFVRNSGSQPEFANQKLTFGAMGDSFYEYMLKVWLQGGRTEDIYREMYDHSMQGMHDELLQVSSPSGLVFIADKNSGQLDTKMDHLVCFMGGLLALGAYTDPQGLNSERAQRDLKTAKALTYTCYQMYARMPTGISPEYIQFYEGQDFEIGRGAPHYLLRPETVESFFVLYHLTGDPVYREWGWEVFQSIERYCKTTAGYGQLHDVRKLAAPPEDKMESFFFAETMKYIYLLFDPDTPIDLLNKHVFNTEAHPVRIFPAMDAAGVKNLLK